jgi:alkanesulfonate monooxygenase SsuD/methylene tetrahydromethanopterin reductase-like flavin-dependent oxidoreductase (luciferase family)
MSIGITLSSRSCLSPIQLSTLAEKAGRRGFNWIFVNESGNDALTTAMVLGTVTQRATISTGVMNIFLRHPVLTAAGALTVAQITDGRFVLGLGTGHRLVNEEQLGLQMEQPLAQLREYVTIIRSCIEQGSVDFVGKHYRAKEYQLMIPAIKKCVPIYLAVLGLKAAHLAGQIADGVILNFATPHHVSDIVTAIHEGAEEAGRSPHTIKIVCYMQTMLVPPDQEKSAFHSARQFVGRYGRLRFYRDMFASSGFGEEVSAMEEAKDEEGIIAAVSDELIRNVMLIGNPYECKARLEEYRESGVGVPVIYPNVSEADWMNGINEFIEVFAP